MTIATTTIREQVADKIADQVGAASIKGHQQMVETLYVTADGDVFWDAQPSTSTWLEREDGTLTSIYRTGTGSVACNCDACTAGDNPEDWAGNSDDIGYLADELAHKLNEVPVGFFTDEVARG